MPRWALASLLEGSRLRAVHPNSNQALAPEYNTASHSPSSFRQSLPRSLAALTVLEAYFLRWGYGYMRMPDAE